MAPKALRPILIEGNLAFIPLTKGYEAIIDAEDVPLVNGRNWRALVCPRATYAVASGVRTAYLHRTIMGEPEGMEVDHRDGNGLNCRRENLRAASVAQNAMNRGAQSNNTSGFKGVTWHKKRKRWQAQIHLNRKQVFLGYFDDPVAAHGAYCAACVQLHGEFNRTA